MNTDSEDRVMIAELERIIRAEEAKPEAERDRNLIDDCIKEIAEIKGVKAEFSEEEVAQITDKLIQTAEKTKKRKRFVRLVAGIAAMFVIVTGVTACAVNPALVNWVLNIVHMPLGAAIEQGTITYQNQGSSIEYKSIEELLTSNNLDVYYPVILPEQCKMTGVEILYENKTMILCFDFSSPDLHFTIQYNNQEYEGNQDIITEIDVNNLHFDVYSKQGSYIAYSSIENNMYIIQSKDIQEIIMIVGGLKKG